jgi:hypothetical protein
MITGGKIRKSHCLEIIPTKLELHWSWHLAPTNPRTLGRICYWGQAWCLQRKHFAAEISHGFKFEMFENTPGHAVALKKIIIFYR